MYACDLRTYKYAHVLTFVTGFAKTLHVCTKTEIHFIPQDYSYTQRLSMHNVSTVQCELVCFSGGHFADPVVSQLRDLELLPLLHGRLLDMVGMYIVATPGGHSYTRWPQLYSKGSVWKVYPPPSSHTLSA